MFVLGYNFTILVYSPRTTHELCNNVQPITEHYRQVNFGDQGIHFPILHSVIYEYEYPGMVTCKMIKSRGMYFL